jgi:hypothetical protein
MQEHSKYELSSSSSSSRNNWVKFTLVFTIQIQVLISLIANVKILDMQVHT